jgi:hypothetical protein
VTVDDVIEMVKRLPANKLAVAYNVIALIQARAEDDAEDALWDAIAAQYADKHAQMEARIGASLALPMFDENGR